MGRPKKDAVSSPTKTFKVNDTEFTDITGRTYLTYEFNNGRILTIYEPKGIAVRENGGTYIVTLDGWYVYVMPSEGWFTHWRDTLVAEKPTIF